MEILIQQETSLHQVEVRNNEKEVAKLLHPNFREVGKSGRTFDYSSIIETMRNDTQTDTTVHAQDFECIQLQQGICLLLYRSAVIDSMGKIGSFAKRSSIWVKVGNNWQLRYHQGTPCDEFELSK